MLKTNNIDHHRTADFPALAAALSGKPDITATMREVSKAPAILLIGNDPTEQHPLLAWQIRNNVRLHRAKLYMINSRIDQAQAAGNQLHADPRRVSQTRSWPTLPAMSMLSMPPAALRRRGSPSAISCGPSKVS